MLSFYIRLVIRRTGGIVKRPKLPSAVCLIHYTASNIHGSTGRQGVIVGRQILSLHIGTLSLYLRAEWCPGIVCERTRHDKCGSETKGRALRRYHLRSGQYSIRPPSPWKKFGSPEGCIPSTKSGTDYGAQCKAKSMHEVSDVC